MKDINGNEVYLNSKTFNEIADHYFDSPYCREAYTKEELALLKEGFINGLEYLYPQYDVADRLVRIYEKLFNDSKNK